MNEMTVSPVRKPPKMFIEHIAENWRRLGRQYLSCTLTPTLCLIKKSSRFNRHSHHQPSITSIQSFSISVIFVRFLVNF
jgi:hypothetical protein